MSGPEREPGRLTVPRLDCPVYSGPCVERRTPGAIWGVAYGKKSRAVLSRSREHAPDLPPPTLVARLEKIDAASIVMAGGVRVFIRPGLWFPGCRLGTNLAVWAHLKHGAICAEWVEPVDTVESGHPGIELARRRETAGILMEQ